MMESAETMKMRLFPALLLAMLTLAGFNPPVSARPDEDIGFPSVGQQCTSFCLDNGDYCVFGANMDHGNHEIGGQLFVNQRYVLKTGWQASTTGEYARWISKYGSVTLNVAGYQLAWGGMNEAGLMISQMSLLETEAPAPDERPPITSPFWIQYQLDNSSTVGEVIASEAQVRSTDEYGHYLVCDRTGDCAIIEFLDGEMVIYTDDSLPVQALANSSYQDSLTALEGGNYWKVSVYSVEADGPAAEAGILEKDWVLAVDGVELAGEQSMETFYSIIAQHEAGDELSLTLVHLGETDPVTLTLKMAPLPEDMSQYIFPPGIPVQQLSLGFMPTYPGDFLTRFVTAVEWVEAFELAGPIETVAYAFEALNAVSTEDTVYSAVFDPTNLRVYFRTNLNQQIRYVDFSQLNFSCGAPVMMLDVNAGQAGEINGDLVEYSHEMVLDHSLSVVTNLWQVDVSALYAETILSGFESFACMEDNAAALATPALYVENHPPLLPPLVTWAGWMVFNRLWRAWVVLTLLSLVLVIWRLARDQVKTRAAWLAWVLAVILLGPFGLLACLLVRCRRRLMSQSRESDKIDQASAITNGAR